MKTALPPKLSPPEPEPVQAWARRESSPPLPAQEHRSPCFQVEPDAPMAEHQVDAEAPTSMVGVHPSRCGFLP